MRKQPDIEVDRLLTQRELAERWSCSKRTLQRWRASDDGPSFVRLGRGVRYPLADVVIFEQRNRNGSRQQ
ncbi:helix-turn-helix domain-containing protein [Rhodobacter sp. SY28-1]|uniref:helix-turn-helix domain-containing protein n=1 Tax=Rhodobacter sp. SY28-1 TaxID=2562317 RepID=UPI0010C14AC7